jgi:hypothetical protein
MLNPNGASNGVAATHQASDDAAAISAAAGFAPGGLAMSLLSASGMERPQM